eukprot:2298599-Prymnesium_polylepis.2
MKDRSVIVARSQLCREAATVKSLDLTVSPLHTSAAPTAREAFAGDLSGLPRRSYLLFPARTLSYSAVHLKPP